MHLYECDDALEELRSEVIRLHIDYQECLIGSVVPSPSAPYTADILRQLLFIRFCYLIHTDPLGPLRYHTLPFSNLVKSFNSVEVTSVS
jgi:hypothetical protein